MLLHFATECDFLSDFRAHWTDQRNLGQVSFHGRDATAARQRADVNHENLVLGEFLYLQHIEMTLLQTHS